MIAKLFGIWIFSIIVMVSILIYREPRKVSSRTLLYYYFTFAFNILSLISLSTIPLVTILIENDSFCNTKFYDHDGFIPLIYIFNFIGFIFWICESIMLVIYIYKYQQFKNN